MACSTSPGYFAVAAALATLPPVPRVAASPVVGVVGTVGLMPEGSAPALGIGSEDPGSSLSA